MSDEAFDNVQVRYGNRDLGEFRLPRGKDAATVSGSRQLLAPPEWNDPNDRRIITWLETGDPDADPFVVHWIPQTPQEQAEAERFHEASHNRPSAQPVVGGPDEWLLGFEYGGGYMYVLPLDDERLFEPLNGPNAKEPFFATDPREAAIMTHERAVTLVPKMMKKFQIKKGDPTYFEPVRFESALAEYGSDP